GRPRGPAPRVHRPPALGEPPAPRLPAPVAPACRPVTSLLVPARLGLGLRLRRGLPARRDRRLRRADPRRADPHLRVWLVEPGVRRAGPVAAVEVNTEGARLLVAERPVVAELALRRDFDREQAVVAVDAGARHEV